MTISELIAKLEYIRETEGDLKVNFWDADYYSSATTRPVVITVNQRTPGPREWKEVIV